MYVKHFYDTDLAQGSYLIGCQATGEAVVVDPRRDVQVYLAEAERQGFRIIQVTETHIHADYLSGSRELAAATGATLSLSGEGGEDWQYAFGDVKLHDGDEIKVGNLTLKTLHTPGHTPEHLSFLLTDGAQADQPGFMLSGDFVFVGDVGRPDLLDEVAGGQDSRFGGAKQLFKSLQMFLTLPDYMQVWPGHGAGSACGKALGAVASSTVGYERAFSWWAPSVEGGDEAGFIEALLEGQPDAPHYFGRMKRENRAGPALLGERPPLLEYAPAELSAELGRVSLIDTRGQAAYLTGAVPGSFHIPAGNSFATYAAYILGPDHLRPIVLLARDRKQAQQLRDKLSYVGIDNVAGYVTSLAGLETHPIPTLVPDQLGGLGDPFILDVRTQSEYAAGHLPEAHQLHAGRVMWHLDTLPKTQPIILHCQSGARATVVMSALLAHGYDNVTQLRGSYLGWKAWRQQQG